MKKILIKLYEALPFKIHAYKLLRRIVNMPKFLQPYFYFSGDFTTKIGAASFVMRNYGYKYHVENELFWGGIANGWEKTSTGLWIKMCAGQKVILDIGANTGFYSVLAKTLVPSCSVHAFEPLPSIQNKLRTNCKLNNIHVHCSDLALSNFEGEATVYPTSMDHVYSVTVNKNLTATKKVFEVKIKTKKLESYIEENGIDRIDVMKIDVETHEVEVLEGMGKYLQAFKPDMLIEIQSNEIAAGITKLIGDIDYWFFNINEKDGVRRVSKLEKSDSLNFLICKPETARRINIG